MPSKKDIQFEQPSDLLIIINKYLTVVIGLIVLVILLIGYYILLNPKIIKIQDIQLATSQYIDEQQRDETLINEMKDLQVEYERILVSRRNDLDKIKSMFPDQPQFAELFVMADQLAQNRGFALRSVEFAEDVANTQTAPVLEEIRPEPTGEDASFQTPNSTRKDTELKSIIVQMQVYTPVEEGISKVSFGEPVEPEDLLTDYENFKLFLDDLERNLRLMDIQTINFGALEEDPGISELFDFSIITYYRG